MHSLPIHMSFREIEGRQEAKLSCFYLQKSIFDLSLIFPKFYVQILNHYYYSKVLFAGH